MIITWNSLFPTSTTVSTATICKSSSCELVHISEHRLLQPHVAGIDVVLVVGNKDESQFYRCIFRLQMLFAICRLGNEVFHQKCYFCHSHDNIHHQELHQLRPWYCFGKIFFSTECKWNILGTTASFCSHIKSIICCYWYAAHRYIKTFMRWLSVHCSYKACSLVINQTDECCRAGGNSYS